MLAIGMGPSDSSPHGQSPKLRCAACHDVIGVYEPLMHVFGTSVRRTSLAAEPDVAGAAGHCYHMDCHARLTDATGMP